MAKYTKKLGEEIANKLADGFDVTIKDIICDKNGKKISEMPSEAMLYRWIKKYPEFKSAYDEARKTQAHSGNDFIVMANRELLDTDGLKMPQIHALCHYIKNLQYIEEKKFWRYDVQSRLDTMEEKLGLSKV